MLKLLGIFIVRLRAVTLLFKTYTEGNDKYGCFYDWKR